MARILFPTYQSWFDELNTVASYYESEFETTIISHVASVFPDYFTVKYKRTIFTSEGGAGKAPDLALIKKDYSEWWIVEVELSEHKLDHVQPQVEVFLNGEYNAFEVAKYIKTIDRENLLNKSRLETMIRDNQPRVMVIVDSEESDWRQDIESLGVLVCFFEIYKNKQGERAYRLNGNYPLAYEKSSHCGFVKNLNNILEIHEPRWFMDNLSHFILIENDKRTSRWQRFLQLVRIKETIEAPTVNTIQIDFLGKVTKWQIVHHSTRALLKPFNINYLDVNATYEIFVDSKHKLYLKAN